MSRPSDKLRQPTVSDQPAVRARAADAGIARGPGLAVAGVTAAVVFVIGQQLFPVRPKQPPAPPPATPTAAETPPTPPPPPPTPTPAADAAAAVVAAPPAAEAGAVAVK